MDRHQHFGFSLVLAVIVGIIMYFLNFMDFLFYLIAIFAGGFLPDILDPPTDYKHRKFFHSRRVLKFLYIAFPVTLLIGIFFNWILFLFFLDVGYIGHLWLDSTTPMGLPK